MDDLCLTMRDKVERLERVLETAPQVHCPIRNYFAPGLYAREMTVPAGVIATGAVHKTEHLTVIVGHCIFTTDDGPKELIGHNTVSSQPGAKRAVVAITDTVITTFHPTHETDPEKLAVLLTESTHDQLMGGANNRQAVLGGHQTKEIT